MISDLHGDGEFKLPYILSSLNLHMKRPVRLVAGFNLVNDLHKHIGPVYMFLEDPLLLVRMLHSRPASGLLLPRWQLRTQRAVCCGFLSGLVLISEIFRVCFVYC